MMQFLRKTNGVITILVSLLLAGVLSLGTLVIEAARYQAAKNQLTDATISSATSMIASYDPELFERYGLLAIDTERFTEERCRDYVDHNADLSPSFFGNRATRMYSVTSIELQSMYNLTYPAILKQQIQARAKYHIIPQNYALNIYNIDSFFTDLKSKCDYVSDALAPTANGSASAGSKNDVSEDMLKALNALYETFKDVKRYDKKCSAALSSGTMSILPSVTGTVETPVPPEDTAAIQEALSSATSVIGSAAAVLHSNGTTFSQTDVSFNPSAVADMTKGIKDVESLENPSAAAKTYAASCRAIAQSINAAINMLESDKDGNLLLNSYISEYFSNRSKTIKDYAGPAKGHPYSGENGNFASACVEYIFGGDESEQVNQVEAYNYLLAIRLVNNLYAVLNNSSSFRSGNAYSTLAHIAWAYYETCADMELLAKYSADVPLNKYSPILNVNSCGAVASAFEAKDFAGAMNSLGIYNGSEYRVSGADSCTYSDSLALALWLVPNSVKMLRVADLIQLEMRYREAHIENKGASFLMSEQNTYCRLKCDAELNTLLPIITLDSDGGVDGVTFSSIKYMGY